MAGRPRNQVRQVELIESMLGDARKKFFGLAAKYRNPAWAPEDPLNLTWGRAMDAVRNAHLRLGVLLKRLREKFNLPSVADAEVEMKCEYLEIKRREQAGEPLFDDGDADEPGDEGDADEGEGVGIGVHG